MGRVSPVAVLYYREQSLSNERIYSPRVATNFNVYLRVPIKHALTPCLRLILTDLDLPDQLILTLKALNK